MARRSLVIGLFVVLAQLAMGCHHHKHFLHRHCHDSCCEPVTDCGCYGSYPMQSAAPPVIEPLPAPKKMPSGELTGRERLGLQR